MAGENKWLEELQALSHSQGFLTYADINGRLPLTMVDPEDIEQAVERLKATGIRIVPDSES